MELTVIDGLFQTYLLYGRHYNRIPYGQESNAEKKPFCLTCEVDKGKLHLLGCNMEQCPACGSFSTGCECKAWDECSRCEAKVCYCSEKEIRKISSTEQLGIKIK